LEQKEGEDAMTECCSLLVTVDTLVH